MSTVSKIEWTEATWNPTVGCTRKSRGCDNCYAVRHTQRLAGKLPIYQGLVNPGKRHFNGTVRTVPERLEEPLRWRKPRRVFVNSMSDLFHDDVPFEFIDCVFAVMAVTPHHTYQILTKRPERMAEYLGDGSGPHRIRWAGPPGRYELIKRAAHYQLPPRWKSALIHWPLPNVWLGTSVEDQSAADERIPHLLRTPAAVRFLSCEPLLGPVDLSWWLERLDREAVGLADDPLAATLLQGGMDDGLASAPTLGERLHWCIAGGESGPGARPCDVAWIRSLVDQCQAAGVAAFVKQLGARPTDRNDTFSVGEDPPTPQHWPDGVEPHDEYWPQYQGETCPIALRDRKGGDPEEWPADLRVREFPRAAEVVG